jgi:Ni,Fe-hydrogenase III small subunit/NAD-dependent dihydropyrimidine dehydrogenase PreA subunit
MLKSIAVRISQGKQYIPDPRTATPTGFRGLPRFSDAPCATGCDACVQVCPSQAITALPLAIDLGKCVLCGDCARACPEGKITFTSEFRMAASTREALVISEAKPALDPVRVSGELERMFGRSLKLRSVSAGGCNGCETELNALSNVNFDLGRYGIDFVASPRHADGLVLTGPISRNMSEALRLCWDAMPSPKFVIAVGACAISGGAFASSEAIVRDFLGEHVPALYVPGCPPHPLTFLCGLLDLLGIAS